MPPAFATATGNPQDECELWDVCEQPNEDIDEEFNTVQHAFENKRWVTMPRCGYDTHNMHIMEETTLGQHWATVWLVYIDYSDPPRARAWPRHVETILDKPPAGGGRKRKTLQMVTCCSVCNAVWPMFEAHGLNYAKCHGMFFRRSRKSPNIRCTVCVEAGPSDLPRHVVCVDKEDVLGDGWFDPFEAGLIPKHCETFRGEPITCIGFS